MTTDNIKRLLIKHWPNSEGIPKIIDARYLEGMLFIKFSDGQRVIYSVDDGKIYSYKSSIIVGSDQQKLKSVFREIKLTTIIDE